MHVRDCSELISNEKKKQAITEYATEYINRVNIKLMKTKINMVFVAGM